MSDPNLLVRYNIPTPRYTSYPTVPFWDKSIDPARWQASLTKTFSETNTGTGISLYLHLPFCESLCTYCGCNKKITTNHSVESVYLSALLKEWKLYRSWMNETPLIREMHLGGGTPTFFSAANLEKLVSSILREARVHPEAVFSIEGHPNNTTREQLKTLFRLGFRRISYGVQDHDPVVQRAINRIQPFENVKRAASEARETGYDSINFDLIYGLPFQMQESMHNTVLQSISLKPDRVAFYSYAHVPWTSRAQRLFDEHDLPGPAEKLKLYREGRELFRAHGYRDIGMDHFALPGDELYLAWRAGTLHRNFMGYTIHPTRLLLGLGVSAIGDAGNAFAQNHKSLHDYYAAIREGKITPEKGYFLSPEDEIFRQYILDIGCRGKTIFSAEYRGPLEKYSFPELQKLSADGLVVFDEHQAVVTTAGRDFIRHICRAFDLHMLKSSKPMPGTPVYSKGI
ncbi:MAG TPA: oxygen-independent coproporphyrinogen III oxidase [Puia sp.]|nr:oxygen-independent coproporphyrinogen III oxidase [Puia sp.]